MTRAYLDHASTSPARPEVVEAMLPWLSGERAADPGRVHTEGRMARVAIEEAREQVAALFGARPREVVFTSGATESINAAVWGATSARPEGAVDRRRRWSTRRCVTRRPAIDVVEWPVDGARTHPGG